MGNFTLYADGKETALSEETLSSINDIPENTLYVLKIGLTKNILYIRTDKII